MFSDAVEDQLAGDNPFARLGLATGRGRQDIIVLTCEEVHDLAGMARRHYGERFGAEVEALIPWGAYTCMRLGESFAARYSRLDGDVYDLRRQFNSTVGRETSPKHNSTGLIYAPEPAQRARHDDGGRLVLELYGHPDHDRTIERIRRAYTGATVTPLKGRRPPLRVRFGGCSGDGREKTAVRKPENRKPAVQPNAPRRPARGFESAPARDDARLPGG